jgi:deazaflavin-dependent oxidoreductase (nitroreductase family)
MGWPIPDRSARAMYAGGRGNATARRLSRFWSAAFAAGLFPRRGVTLEVTGRRTGRVTRFPLIAVDVHGEWYLVSMLGEDCNWVRNVRAAGGRAVVVRRRRRHPQVLVEVPAAEQAGQPTRSQPLRGARLPSWSSRLRYTMYGRVR